MSKIFELFGYRLDKWDDEAQRNCAQARCPFMDCECDGGGNRYSSQIKITNTHPLKSIFPDKSVVQVGVCSLSVRDGEAPWIVCPRRLLSLRNNVKPDIQLPDSQPPDYQANVKEKLSRYMGLTSGYEYRIWSELKMKVGTTNSDEEKKHFDYTFDYILAGSAKVLLSKVAADFELTTKQAKNIAEKNGFTLGLRDGDTWIEDFPSGEIVIVEIMTSSTSGGDASKRTQIAMAFEDALLNPYDISKHNGPGINYRQVWARMVSQLIVKSQVGMAWGGKTIWLIQDVLAEYISKSTALDLEKYLSNQSSQVNILAFGYGSLDSQVEGESIFKLKESKFYSGPITENKVLAGSNAEENETKPHDRGGFVEIVKIGAPPPISHLWRSLFYKKPSGFFKA